MDLHDDEFGSPSWEMAPDADERATAMATTWTVD